jgi:hypothetical protein
VNFTASGAQAGRDAAEGSYAMTTSPAVPAPSTLVEMTGSGGPVCGVRVDAVLDADLILSVPRDTPDSGRPTDGEQVILRWPAGARGRYAVGGTVVDAAVGDRVRVRPDGEPRIEQDRHYVRGGGGEQVRLRLPGPAGTAEAAGWIRDISERGVRAHFTDAEVRDGDPVRLQIQLDDDAVDLTGTVLKVSREPGDSTGGSARVEVVAVFEAGEVQAQIIRRYVLRQQLLTRARTAAD